MSCCSDPFHSMNMDIYYSREEQDRFGKEVKEWTFDRTIVGYAEILGAVDKDGLKNNQFFEYEGKLIGRSKEDPRTCMQGMNYPITSILITNIVDAKTGTVFYTESAGERSGESTVFEIMAVEPYVNPWNEIEYYKILFNRSDRQEIYSD
jgi:hypothetical protein